MTTYSAGTGRRLALVVVAAVVLAAAVLGSTAWTDGDRLGGAVVAGGVLLCALPIALHALPTTAVGRDGVRVRRGIWWERVAWADVADVGPPDRRHDEAWLRTRADVEWPLVGVPADAVPALQRRARGGTTR